MGTCLTLDTAMATVSRISRARVGKTMVFVCDIQETFRELVPNTHAVLRAAHLMLNAAENMGLPVVVTEQYPKAFGSTMSELPVPPLNAGGVTDTYIGGAINVEKTQFGMLVPEVEELLDSVDPEVVVLCGLETHICVQNTALDLLQRGVNVHILADRKIAIERMRSAGAEIATSQAALYELIGDAKAPVFKPMLPAIKSPLYPDADPML